MRSIGIAGIAILLAVGSANAGLYSPDEPFNFEIDSEGNAKPLQFAGGFESIVATLRQAAIVPRTPEEPVNATRQQYLDRVAQRRMKGVASLSPEELAGYTSDLIRVNRAGEALNILQPLARDPRRGGFLAYAHLATAHAATAGWREGLDQQQMAVRYSDFPTSFAKLSKTQLAWLKRVERDYYLPFLSNRADDARGKRSRDLREEVDPLFPLSASAKKTEPAVRYVGEDGEYVAGSIAAAEKKKLPADALAIVQQLVLWHPQDARLYWLLGELYNAEGDIESAMRILDHCSFNMAYSNPILIRHRQILQQAMTAISAQRAAEAEQARQAEAEEKERELQAERERQKRKWWIISIAVGLGVLLLFYQLRETVRRLSRARASAN
jgi:hypothetical protein